MIRILSYLQRWTSPPIPPVPGYVKLRTKAPPTILSASVPEVTLSTSVPAISLSESAPSMELSVRAPSMELQAVRSS